MNNVYNGLPDALGLSSMETILAVVPMFHVNAWGIPYASAMCGTKMVMPGARMDGESLFELMESEEVTLSAGVPTIWMMLLTYMKENNKKLGPRIKECSKSDKIS